jgi:hypothetical protein
VAAGEDTTPSVDDVVRWVIDDKSWVLPDVDQYPTRTHIQVTRHDVMDWREDNVLLDGLNGTDWTISIRL